MSLLSTSMLGLPDGVVAANLHQSSHCEFWGVHTANSPTCARNECIDYVTYASEFGHCAHHHPPVHYSYVPTDTTKVEYSGVMASI